MLCVAIAFIICFSFYSVSALQIKPTNDYKIDTELKNVLNQASEDELIPISIWFRDIDKEDVSKRIFSCLRRLLYHISFEVLCMKKILSFALVLLVLVSSVMFSAFAEEVQEFDEYLTFYFDCPKHFTTDNTVDCVLFESETVIISGELMDNGLYKFTIPIIYDHFWMYFTNINENNRYDEKGNDRKDTDFLKRTHTLLVEDGQVILDKGYTTLGSPEGLIYTNMVYYKSNDFVSRNYYGYGDWMTFEQWQRYHAYETCYEAHGGDYSRMISEEDALINTWYAYKELCFFGSTDDEVQGYNMLCFGADVRKYDEAVYGVYGNYLLRNAERFTPNAFGFYVYNSSLDECFTLREFEERYSEQLNEILTETGIGELIGDVNKDGKLDVRDATFIQKCLADIEVFKEDDVVQGLCEDESEDIFAISDFNRDGKRDIRDATAIRKYLVGLDY